ncbi:NADP-dependent oxidoreductase [Sphingomonas sabuli]|uniref:NADP-dependent oxidoreductase n=1 Tax=Sphingomonas sabuli TaxID=2764186 RepID=A0A7G9L5V8_9SPHN|nr:NADP-dependent oxidoreductase [Sphingomonas sabuli]QNM84007.1 NADP-dependent oxidoreductase [Sphingomonas sabuli]
MARQWQLTSRPDGMPTAETFALREVDLPDVRDGEIRVRNLWLSVDPYMRGRMNESKSYIAPFPIDGAMEGGAIGEVLESKADGFAKGDLVSHFAGWRDEAVISTKGVHKLPDIGATPQSFLSILGMPGATAYFGLFDVAAAKDDDIVFVSAAAGAVGSAVVQLAKARGMTVIGSAGGAEKCDLIRSLGADEAVDYKAGSILGGLKQAAPKGIDVYFDNVGSDHLDAAFACSRQWARFALCGMIAGYNSREPAQFKYIIRMIASRITMRGFLYGDYVSRLDEFYREMGQLVAAGKVTAQETVFEGLETTPDAFLGLFSGANSGKMLVRV